MKSPEAVRILQELKECIARARENIPTDVEQTDLFFGSSSTRKAVMYAICCLLLSGDETPEFYNELYDEDDNFNAHVFLDLMGTAFHNGNGELKEVFDIGQIHQNGRLVNVFVYPTNGETHREDATPRTEAENKALDVVRQISSGATRPTFVFSVDSMGQVIDQDEDGNRTVLFSASKPSGDKNYPQNRRNQRKLERFRNRSIGRLPDGKILNSTTSGVLFDHTGERAEEGSISIEVILDVARIIRLRNKLDPNAGMWGILQHLLLLREDGSDTKYNLNLHQLHDGGFHEQRVKELNLEKHFDFLLVSAVMGAPASILKQFIDKITTPQLEAVTVR